METRLLVWYFFHSIDREYVLNFCFLFPVFIVEVVFVFFFTKLFTHCCLGPWVVVVMVAGGGLPIHKMFPITFE